MSDHRDQKDVERYLLFALPDGSPRGGSDALVGSFTIEEEARRAFREVRLSPTYRQGWAELVLVGEPSRTPKRLSWFGDRVLPAQHRTARPRPQGGPMPVTQPAPVAPAPEDTSGRPTAVVQRRQWRGIAAIVVGLLAAAGAALGLGVLNGDNDATGIAPGGGSEPLIPFVVTDEPSNHDWPSSLDG